MKVFSSFFKFTLVAVGIFAPMANAKEGSLRLNDMKEKLHNKGVDFKKFTDMATKLHESVNIHNARELNGDGPPLGINPGGNVVVPGYQGGCTDPDIFGEVIWYAFVYILIGAPESALTCVAPGLLQKSEDFDRIPSFTHFLIGGLDVQGKERGQYMQCAKLAEGLLDFICALVVVFGVIDNFDP